MALLVFAFWQEDTEKEFFRSPDFKKLKADLVLYDVKYRRDSAARASEWEVKAASARFYEKRKECEFEKVKILFLMKKKNPVTITAARGTYDFSSGKLKVTGDVVVRGFRDYVLYADMLVYDPASVTIQAPGRAELVGAGGNRLDGKSMVYYLKKDTFTLASPEAVIQEGEAGL